jgi:hypothetical protein
LEGGQGLLLAEQDGALAEQCRMLLQDDAMAQQMSLRARAQIEERFGFDVTYGSLAEELRTFVEQGAMSAVLNPCPR